MGKQRRYNGDGSKEAIGTGRLDCCELNKTVQKLICESMNNYIEYGNCN
jgi:hypothetical protein